MIDAVSAAQELGHRTDCFAPLVFYTRDDRANTYKISFRGGATLYDLLAVNMDTTHNEDIYSALMDYFDDIWNLAGADMVMKTDMHHMIYDFVTRTVKAVPLWMGHSSATKEVPDPAWNDD